MLFSHTFFFFTGKRAALLHWPVLPPTSHCMASVRTPSLSGHWVSIQTKKTLRSLRSGAPAAAESCNEGKKMKEFLLGIKVDLAVNLACKRRLKSARVRGLHISVEGRLAQGSAGLAISIMTTPYFRIYSRLKINVPCQRGTVPLRRKLARRIRRVGRTSLTNISPHPRAASSHSALATTVMTTTISLLLIRLSQIHQHISRQTPRQDARLSTARVLLATSVDSLRCLHRRTAPTQQTVLAFYELILQR